MTEYHNLIIKGEVYTDKVQRALYATDASMYQILPDMVAIPKDEEDVRTILQYALKNKIPIVPRGSATSLAGQTVNKGIVIDFSKYFNKIIAIHPEEKKAVVMPGVTRDQLNTALAPYKLHFAPDPATSDRATFGGMIANNSSGTKSILYGKTSDHVISLKVMLTDGTTMVFEKNDEKTYTSKSSSKSREGEIYKTFRELIFTHAEEIENRFPKVMRRVSGYALDEFITDDEWNLSKLITGSEGTLATILEATVRLELLPSYQNMVIIHYDDRHKGIDTVAEIVKFGPAAVEVLDYNVIRQSKINPITKKYHDSVITGEPDLVLTVEFFGYSKEDVEQKANALVKYLEKITSVFASPIYDEVSKINDALALRKEGLGLLMGKVAPRKPQAFIEDPAIPLEHLSEYVRQVTDICTKRGVEIVIYAHASVGVLHIRPYLDMTDEKDISLMKEISDETFKLVKKYNGSWSGEHGDGRNRGHKIREYFGEEIYGIFKRIKELFDPQYILNPDIIIDTPPMDQNLRYGGQYRDSVYNFMFHYRKDHSFNDIVHMCSGVGACRKTKGGTMCPSFRATHDEKDSTRGRANILRLAMSGQYQFSGLEDENVIEVLDLCLSCKACKTECPSNVDMAKLKSEVLQLYYDKHGVSLSKSLTKYAPKTSRLFSGKVSTAINFIQKSSIFRSYLHHFAGIHKDRILPDYAKESLVHWAKSNNHFKSNNKVVFFTDTYLNNHQPEVGIKAVKLLNSCGYEVIIEDFGCCQRPLISNGHLRDAKKNGSITASRLLPFFENNVPILTFEPSCHSALTDDLPDLISDENLAALMNDNIRTIEVFLADEHQAGKLTGQFSINVPHIIIHGHCHQKASYGTKATKYLLQISNAKYEELNTGCCGMAGAFGYEKNHYKISLKIAEESLGPALDEHPNSVVVAHGFSCKHQIADIRNRKVNHIIELLEYKK